jgi:hypothetical protein
LAGVLLAEIIPKNPRTFLFFFGNFPEIRNYFRKAKPEIFSAYFPEDQSVLPDRGRESVYPS